MISINTPEEVASKINMISKTKQAIRKPARLVVKKETLVLFANSQDYEMVKTLSSKNQDRRVEVISRPSWDTGFGPCGRHLCHCKEHCGEK